MASIKRCIRRAGWALCVCVLLLGAQQKSTIDKTTMDQWMKELSNWGRWGKTDQMGTVNLITPAKRKAAAALVTEGHSVSLSSNTDMTKSVENPRPFGHDMISSGAEPNTMFAMDTYTISYHGAVMSHFDSLSHMFYEGKMYNGYSEKEVGRQGANQLAVTAFKNGFFSRGVLMDIPRLKGVKYLEISTPIYPSDLEAWEKKAGIKVGSGDIVFVRTGRWARRADKGQWDIQERAAGLHPSCARWFKQRDIAILGTDSHSELKPTGMKDIPYPMHQLLLIAMGTPMFDNLDLEAVSEAAAKRNRWEFLLTCSPLAIPKGTGSPLNPIATF